MGFCSSAPPLPGGAEANRSLALTDTVERVTAALAVRYKLERELGRGGMATVWLARDLKRDRPVVLKVLRPELAAALGPDRFLREIKLTAQLDHPYILPVFDSGAAQGLVWYTMPFIDGGSLRQRLQREGRLSTEETVRLTAEIPDALDCAHRHGVAHRHVKPENVHGLPPLPPWTGARAHAITTVWLAYVCPGAAPLSSPRPGAASDRVA